MSLQADTFLEWLDEQENLRNWSDYEVAKNAGISHSVISRGNVPEFLLNGMHV